MRQSQLITILDAQAANGVGLAALVDDYRHLMIEIVGASSPDLNVRAQLSFEDTAPDFSAAQSTTNMWDYADMVDVQDGASVNGDTGITFSGTADVRMFEIDTNGARWVNFRVLSYVAGNVTVKVRAFRD